MRLRVFIIGITLFLSNDAFAEVRTIRCPAEPPTVSRYELRELWRIDADDPDAPIMGGFGPHQIVATGGRVYLLDGQLCQIQVFSDDGEHLDTILGEGEGPGEVRRPGQMILRADGRLAVQHGHPTKLEIIDRDGTPHARWQMSAYATTYRIQEAPDGWFAVYAESIADEDADEWVSMMNAVLLDDKGERTGTFHRERLEDLDHGGKTVDEQDQYDPWFRAVFVGDDQVVLASSRDEYRLEWHSLNGEKVRIVTRDFPAHRRTEDELARLKYSNYSISNGDFQWVDIDLCETDWMIDRIDPLPDGGLRVRTSLFQKDMPVGMVCRYEVHEPTGELRERVEIFDPTGDFDTDHDRVALLDDGRVMILRNLQSAARAQYITHVHPKVREKMPPPPDDRDDIAFTPIMCELVPR